MMVNEFNNLIQTKWKMDPHSNPYTIDQKWHNLCIESVTPWKVLLLRSLQNNHSKHKGASNHTFILCLANITPHHQP